MDRVATDGAATGASAVVRVAAPADAPAIARVRVDAWRSTYRGMIPDAYLDGMSVAESEAHWRRILEAAPGRFSVFVAVEGDEVVGFAAGHVLDPAKLGCDAELSAIYLTAGRRRTGIGRRLAGTVAAAQRGHGATALLTWVIAGNRPARAFYEALGAELLVEQPFQWDGIDLVEAGYGFRDLDRLVAACGGMAALH
jgi:GNAT superfamily N-acetyltransferase